MANRQKIKWISRTLWTTAVLLLLPLALYVGVGRMFVDNLESNQQTVIDFIKKKTPLTFTVGKLSGEWSGLTPVIRIENFTLYNPLDNTEVVLSVKKAKARLDILSSLMNWRVGVGILNANQLNVTLAEQEHGRWSVKGFVPGQQSMSLDPIVDSLLAIESAKWDAAKVTLQAKNGTVVAVWANALSLEADDTFRRVKFDLALAEGTEAISALLEIAGDPRDFSTFEAQGVLEFADTNLEPILNLSEKWRTAVSGNLELDGRLWIEKKIDQPLLLWGEIRSEELPITVLQSKDDNRKLTDFFAQLAIEIGEKNIALHVSQLSAQYGQQGVQFNDWRVDVDSALTQLTFSMAELSLSYSQQLMQTMPFVPVSIHTLLGQLQPQGRLHNVHMRFPIAQLDDWVLRANLRDVAVTSWNGVPNLEGVNGYLALSKNEGAVQLRSQNFRLGFPTLYSESLVFDEIASELSWTITDKAFVLSSGPLYALSQNVPISGLFSVAIPLNDPNNERDALMSLNLGFRQIDASVRNAFIPEKVLDKQLKQWLDQSIKSGRVIAGNYVYRGSLEKNDRQDRTSQLWLDVVDGQLAYQPNLPEVTQADVDVYVDDNEVVATVASAKMFTETDLSDVKVNVATRDGVSYLSVDGQFEAKDQSALQILQQGLVRDSVKGAFDTWQWKGVANGQVSVELALGGTSKKKPNVVVDVAFEGGKLFADGVITDANNITGDLQYHSVNGVSSSGISLLWHGSPLQLVVSQQKNTTVIDGYGTITSGQLKSWLKQPIFDFTSGAINHTVQLRVAPDDTQLSVKSDLQGFGIGLPEPYKKVAKDAWLFELNGTLGKQVQQYNLNFADRAMLQLELSNNQVGGVLALGQHVARALEPNQFQITGNVGEVDLSAWFEWVKAYQLAGKRMDSAGRAAKKKNTSNASEVISNDSISVVVNELMVGRAQLGSTFLNQVNVHSARETESAWMVDVDAELLAGRITYSKLNHPLLFELERINLPPPKLNDPLAAKLVGGENCLLVYEDFSSLLDVNFDQLVDADISIKTIYRGEKPIGRLNTQMRINGNVLSLHNFVGDLFGLRIGATEQGVPAELKWIKNGDLHRTEIKGEVQFNNLGDSLESFGLERVVESRSGRIEVDASWPQPPDDPDIDELSGALAFTASNGRFPQTSASASGALRVIGIFNFDNVLRRLRFDFTDIYRSGITYDRLNGAIRFDRGQMVFTSPLDIVGPGSQFKITGDIHFPLDRTNMELVATLPIASNLPWFAAIAGGFPFAAGAYVFSKVFENSVNNLSSVVYSINGSWSDPQVTFKQIYDSSP